jgi:hypothetical protein
MLMGPIELCLLSLLSAQEPNTNAPPVAGQAAVSPVPTATAPAQEPVPPIGSATTTTTAADPHQQDPRKALQAAEQAGNDADGPLLAELAMASDAQVAARATWLLAHNSNAAHQALLPNIAANSPHPEARLQALQAIRVQGDIKSMQLAIAALADDDARVRTVAVKLLGKLRRPSAVEPLLDLVRSSSKLEGTEPATDVQAALLTLSDLDASQHLLRMSTAIGDGQATGAGDALTYAFQTLSPKLDTAAETTVLVAVLDHKEAMLRRYAITRLTELDSKTALTALEGRLGKEDRELRPLLEVAIAQIRHDGKAPPKDEVERAKANAKVLLARTKSWWQGLVPTQKAMVGASPIVLILLMWLTRRATRRRHHDEEALALAAMVQPSDEYLDQQDAEYEDYEDGDYEEYEDGEYDEQGEFVEGDYEEGFEEEGDDQQEFDTSGWDDDGDATVPADSTPEDELFR